MRQDYEVLYTDIRPTLGTEIKIPSDVKECIVYTLGSEIDILDNRFPDRAPAGVQAAR